MVLGLTLAPGLAAQELLGKTGQAKPPLYVADIALETPEELLQLLDRAEQLLNAAVNFSGEEAQVTFVLHGPVLQSLLRDNYLQNKQLVERAAALSALQVIELQACRTWMSGNGLKESQLLPFVETVDYGPKAVQTLVRDEGRVYF